MTKREAAIVSAYTGCIVAGASDEDLHDYTREVLGFYPGLADILEVGRDKIAARIKEKAEADFLALKVK